MFKKVQRVIFCLLQKLEMFVDCKRNDASPEMVPNLGTFFCAFFLIFEEEVYEKKTKYHKPI